MFRKEVRVIGHDFYYYIASSVLAVILLISYILVMVTNTSRFYTTVWFPIPLFFLGGYLIFSVPATIKQYKENKQVYDVWHDPQALVNLLKLNNWKAAIAVAHFTSEDSVVKVLTDEMMDNPNWLIRKWSAWALGYTADKKSILDLIEVIQYDSAPEVRENAIQALMNMNAIEEALEQLQGRASADPSLYVRRKARKALALHEKS